MMTSMTSAKPNMLSRRLPAGLTTLALAASLLAIAGCSPKTPPPPTTTATATPATSAAPGQSPVSIKPEANEAAEPPHTWTDQQILTCTVAQCWQLANKNEDEFFDIIQQLAAVSAKNRNISLPDSEAAGQQAGQIIKGKAKADHDQLLFAVVDDAVRKIGKPAPQK
jgi:hypothetical protein